jgi:hypothetical protein
MIRLAPPCLAALVACTPPQDATMHSPSPFPAKAAEADHEAQADSLPAASEPGFEPTAAVDNAASARRPDSPAEAQGRRILSTAFVRVGPDGLLTVQLRDGRVVVLRNVVMRPRDYTGTQVSGGSAGRAFRGDYGQVAAARPGEASFQP